MRGGRRGLWGVTAIVLGVIILLALVLPSEFWWFGLAALTGRRKRSEDDGTAV